MNSKFSFVITAIVTLLICQQKSANAQNLGIEIGTAGVENYDVGVLNYGFSINLSLTKKVSCDLSYNHWQGDDGNYGYALVHPGDLCDGLFWGNNGINLTILYKIYGTNKFSISIGSGLGRYERKRIRSNPPYDTRYFYESTYSLATLLKYKISKNFAIYGKTIISTRSFEDVPDWGVFNLGIELSPLFFFFADI